MEVFEIFRDFDQKKKNRYIGLIEVIVLTQLTSKPILKSLSFEMTMESVS